MQQVCIVDYGFLYRNRSTTDRTDIEDVVLTDQVSMDGS